MINIVLLYEKNDENIDKIERLKDYIEKDNYANGIKLLTKQTQKSKCDVYVISSDNLDNIKKYFEKIPDKKKVLLLTSKLDSTFILNCINITKNISFLGNKCSTIIDRICNLYEETK